MSKLWYYAQGQDKKGPVSESDLRALIQSGSVAGSDLVWTEGMANWAEAGTIQFGPDEALATGAVLAKSPAPLPAGLRGWMSFVGVINIIYGIFSCLSCFGLLSGIFMIIGGSALVGARKMLDGVTTVDPSLGPFFGKLKVFIQMTGIVYVLMILLAIILAVVYAGVFAALLAGGIQPPAE